MIQIRYNSVRYKKQQNIYLSAFIDHIHVLFCVLISNKLLSILLLLLQPLLKNVIRFVKKSNDNDE